MKKQNPNVFKLSQVQGDSPRPLWSVMIPTYNCANYLRETLTSVLAQNISKDAMQIMVVDDCSSDDPESVVKELGNGRVEFYRQESNVGQVRNFQTCLERSQGQLVHLLHGDDLVCEGFYQKMAIGFEKHPEIGAAFCRHIIMDENTNEEYTSILEQTESGLLEDTWLELIAGFQRIQTPSIVVKREVYETIGGFDHRFVMALDWEMWVRVARYYPIWYEVEPLAKYRKHANSVSSKTIANGIYNRELLKAIDTFQTYLPKDIAKRVYHHSRRNCAFHSLVIADTLVKKDQILIALVQIREALNLSTDFLVIRSAGRIILLDGSLWLLRWIKKLIKNNNTNNSISNSQEK